MLIKRHKFENVCDERKEILPFVRVIEERPRSNVGMKPTGVMGFLKMSVCKSDTLSLCLSLCKCVTRRKRDTKR